jgi:hypothetical protein
MGVIVWPFWPGVFAAEMGRYADEGGPLRRYDAVSDSVRTGLVKHSPYASELRR